MKKLFSLFLSCVLVLSISPSGMALDNLATIDSTRVSSITNNAVAFLVAANCGNTPEEPIPMYKINEEIEVLYFPLLPDGYLIASYKDGHIYTNVISPGRTDRHAVMAYTYWETANTTYLICDNTWGNTGVHICTDDLDATTRVLYLS